MDNYQGEYYNYNGIFLKCADKNYIEAKPEVTIYEVIRLIDGIPLFYELHFQRLSSSALIKNLPLLTPQETLYTIITKLAKLNGTLSGNIKIIFNYFQNIQYFEVFFINHSYPSDNEYNTGVVVSLLNAERTEPNVKQIIKIRELADFTLQEKKVFEVIYVDNQGFITEGSRSNFFMIKNNDVYTALPEKVLKGITRYWVVEICKQLNIRLIEKNINSQELINMDACFLTGTSPKILPISKIDDLTFNPKNLVLTKIIDRYNQIIDEYLVMMKK